MTLDPAEFLHGMGAVKGVTSAAYLAYIRKEEKRRFECFEETPIISIFGSGKLIHPVYFGTSAFRCKIPRLYPNTVEKISIEECGAYKSAKRKCSFFRILAVRSRGNNACC